MRHAAWRVAFVAMAAAVAPVAQALEPAALGVVYRTGDPASTAIAREYVRRRGIPSGNLVGIDVPDVPVLAAGAVERLRVSALRRLPATVAALLLVWTRPYAAGCMSITSAFAAGYRPEYCEPGCGRTGLSPLYDADSLEPALARGWRPVMQLPSEDPALARALIARGLAADGSHPGGTVYLVSTGDAPRNVRAAGYADVVLAYGGRIDVRPVTMPGAVAASPAIAYFTGVARVVELPSLRFRPGAVADHLTSIGGVADQSLQTTALDWLVAGATASYGTVSEPCNVTGKFPSPVVFLGHYLRGESLLEAYWKSVAMPGQGLFVGEPLAAPFAARTAGAAVGGTPWGP